MPPCSAAVPDRTASGDDLYGPRACWQAFIDWAWPALGFQNDFWRAGFGYEEVCNRDLPLNRTLGALWLLCYSAEDFNNDSYSNNCLHWARRYVWDQIDDLRALCGDRTAYAGAFQTWFIFRLHAHIELYRDYWYELTVVERAGTLLHEARHLGGRSHNATFPAGSVYGAGRSGADSNWGYEGAWMYHALYLWWFVAAGQRSSPAMREAARQRANLIFDNAFATHPGFTI